MAYPSGQYPYPWSQYVGLYGQPSATKRSQQNETQQAPSMASWSFASPASAAPPSVQSHPTAAIPTGSVYDDRPSPYSEIMGIHVPSLPSTRGSEMSSSTSYAPSTRSTQAPHNMVPSSTARPPQPSQNNGVENTTQNNACYSVSQTYFQMNNFFVPLYQQSPRTPAQYSGPHQQRTASFAVNSDGGMTSGSRQAPQSARMPLQSPATSSTAQPITAENHYGHDEDLPPPYIEEIVDTAPRAASNPRTQHQRRALSENAFRLRTQHSTRDPFSNFLYGAQSRTKSFHDDKRCRVSGCHKKHVHRTTQKEQRVTTHLWGGKTTRTRMVYRRVNSMFCQEHTCRGKGVGWYGVFCGCPKCPEDRLCGCCQAQEG